jgi:hypothetical protein
MAATKGGACALQKLQQELGAVKSVKPLEIQEVMLVFWAEDDDGLLVLAWAELELVLQHKQLPGLCGAGTHAVLHFWETTGAAPVIGRVKTSGSSRRAFSLAAIVGIADALHHHGAHTIGINPSPPEVSYSSMVLYHVQCQHLSRKFKPDSTYRTFAGDHLPVDSHEHLCIRIFAVASMCRICLFAH